MALQNQEIGERIRQLRDERGNPPQTVVAEALGVSERTYQTWEYGEAKPSYRSLQKLAGYFGVGEDFILTGSERDRPAASTGTPDPFAGGQPSELAESLERIEAKLDQILHALEPATPDEAPAALVLPPPPGSLAHPQTDEADDTSKQKKGHDDAPPQAGQQ